MLAGLITALAAVVSDQASKALVFGFLAETQPVGGGNAVFQSGVGVEYGRQLFDV